MKVLGIIGSPREKGNTYNVTMKIEENRKPLGNVEFKYAWGFKTANSFKIAIKGILNFNLSILVKKTIEKLKRQRKSFMIQLQVESQNQVFTARLYSIFAKHEINKLNPKYF